MSILGIAAVLLWGGLLGLWLVRLPLDKLYRPTQWTYLWVQSRVLLRFGIGLFLILWGDGSRVKNEEMFYALVVQASCPAAWEGAGSTARKVWGQGGRVGLLVAKSGEAYWAIPPTRDSLLFYFLWRELQRVGPLPGKSASVSFVLSQLRPWRREIIQVIWLGDFDALFPEVGRAPPVQLASCGRSFSAGQAPFSLSSSEEAIASLPWEEREYYALAFFVCGGLFLGMEVTLYFLRKHLPFC
ncbi:MAG: hypothetical protein N2170_04405 [Bacteroidia bacterium]|nr:hypothetical protein [Bacteroidia bacterium]